MNKAGADGVTEREHLEQVYKQTGVMPKGLEPEEDFPLLLEHIWSAFISLSGGRSMGFSGPNPLSYEQIKAWKELTCNILTPWEVELVKRLDAVYIGVTISGR
jgi:hypothetical protein